MATQMPLFFAGGAYDELADKAELVAISAMAGDFDRGGIDDAKQFRFVADVDGLF